MHFCFLMGHSMPLFSFFKKSHPRPLFHFFFQQTLQFLLQIYVKNVMSIQYSAPGLEPTTFRRRVSSHNHQTRAPASFIFIFLFSIVNMLIIKFCYDQIQTADLWYRKGPLCLLRQNHCPTSTIVISCQISTI